MVINFDDLASRMEELFYTTKLHMKVFGLKELKNTLGLKGQIIKGFLRQAENLGSGKFTREFCGMLGRVSTDYQELVHNFDDNLMIFIVGNGNTGKSTLLNALVGYDAAQTDMLPNTWKIDIYSPSVPLGNAQIVYMNGTVKSFSATEAQQIVTDEENKTKNSEKSCKQRFNIEVQQCNTREARTELRKYMEEKYLYKSDISEVRWNVKSNRLLEKCLLVDTPGLNQNLFSESHKLGSIRDYYHKADGVLWLLDGSTIAAKNTQNLIDELENVLKEVGGVAKRNNIIGVINRMDNVLANGGVKAVEQIVDDAKKIFGKYFTEIIPISARQAFQGVKTNDSELIKRSNIKNLEGAMDDIFLAKADLVKSAAKTQGSEKLLHDFNRCIEQFRSQINEYSDAYHKKQQNYLKSVENFRGDSQKEIDGYFDTYMSTVKSRTNRYIDKLSEGYGTDFIKSTIYEVDTLNNQYQDLISSQKAEITRQKELLQSSCNISEYKYIKTSELLSYNSTDERIQLDLSAINSIKGFTPSHDSDIFSGIGNILGKIGFWFRKDGIIRKINDTMQNECNKLQANTNEAIANAYQNISAGCQRELDKSFEMLLFPFEKRRQCDNLFTDINSSSVYSDLSEVTMKDYLKATIS